MQLSDVGLHETEYVRLQLRDDRDVLLLVFSHLEEPVGRFSMRHTVDVIGASAVLMNTLPRSYYARGIPGLGGDVAATAASLRRIIDAVRPRTVVTLGISMGGYAALLFGGLLGAHRILALSPETELLLPGSRSWWALGGKADPPMRDVLPVLRDAPQSQVAVYFGETDLHDVHAAWRLRPLPGAELFSVQGAGHEIGRWLVERRLLHPLVDGFVHRGEVMREFPQRGCVLDHGAAIELAMGAHALLLARRPEAAADALRRAIRLAPGFDLAYHHLALALVAAGRRRDALEAHRCASDLAPESATYRLQYGRALLDAGETGDAHAVLRAVADANPKLAAAHHALGLAAERLGDRRAAEAAYRQAVACDGADASVLHQLGALQLSEGRWLDAEESYRRAVEVNPALLHLHVQLARARLALGAREAAVAGLRTALRLDPGNSVCLQLLGQAHQPEPVGYGDG